MRCALRWPAAFWLAAAAPSLWVRPFKLLNRVAPLSLFEADSGRAGIKQSYAQGICRSTSPLAEPQTAVYRAEGIRLTHHAAAFQQESSSIGHLIFTASDESAVSGHQDK